MPKKEYVKSADAVNVTKCIEAHKKAYEKWPYGREIETWKDENGNIRVRYATGQWFHYSMDSTGAVQWW